MNYNAQRVKFVCARDLYKSANFVTSQMRCGHAIQKKTIIYKTLTFYHTIW